VIGLIVILLVTLLALVCAVYLLGFRLGGDHWKDELTRVRMESVHAEREMHDLTRQAFVAMAEEADRRIRYRRHGASGGSITPPS
jgi:hypothetical protein